MGKDAGKDLTSRQRKFVENKTTGQTDREAALNAGYSESMANHSTEKIKASPAVQDAFRRILQKAGVTDSLIAARLREGLDAKETKFFPTLAEGKPIVGPDGLPVVTLTGVAREQVTGEDVPSVDCIDFSERRGYIELAMKLQGRIPRDQGDERAPIQIAIIHIDKA